MAAMQDVIRRVQIQASQTGANETSAALLKLAGAQDAVAVATSTTEKSTLSMQSKLISLQRTLDAEFRAEEKLVAIQKTLGAARAQGLVTLTEENRLLDLAAAKYRIAGDSAKVMGESLATAKELAVGLVGGLGAGVVFAGLAELPGKILDAVHEAAGFGHVADVIGITTDKLQELNYAAAQFHVSSDTMDSALERFSKNLGMAATGSGELAKILKANHVTITGDLTKDLENYANLIKNATDEEQRNLLTTTAFGKSAQEMGLLFSEGAAGIKEGADAAEAAGAVLSGPALKSAQDLDKQFVDMKVQMDVTFKDFAIVTAPLVIAALGGITAAVKTLASTTVNWDLVNQQGATFGGRFGQMKPNVKPGPLIPSASPQPSLSLVPANTNSSGAKAADSDGFAALLGKPTIIPSAPDAGAAKIDTVTKSLQKQIDALHQTSREQAEANALAQAGITLNSKAAPAIEKLADKLYDEKKALDDANQAAQFFATTAADAFISIVDGSTDAASAVKNLVKSLADGVLQSALLGQGPLAGLFGTAPTTAGGLGGLLGQLFHPSANGNVYQSPGLHAYVNTVVDHPTTFAFARGAGLMGEAGPEAIVPLKRTAAGQLGVAVANDNGGGGGNIFNFYIDAKGAEIGVEEKIVQAINARVPPMIKSGAHAAVTKATSNNRRV